MLPKKAKIDILLLAIVAATIIMINFVPQRQNRDLDGAWVVERHRDGIELYLTWRTKTAAMNSPIYQTWTPILSEAQRYVDQMAAQSYAIRYDGTAIPITEAKR